MISVIGWLLFTVGVSQLPIWMFYEYFQQKGTTFREKFVNSFKPTADWGPMDLTMLKKYKMFIENKNSKTNECVELPYVY